MRTTGVMQVLIGGSVAAILLASSAESGNLEQIIRSRYPTVQLNRNHEVLQPGAILVVNAGGIGASVAANFTFLNNYKDGRVRRGVGSSLIADKNTARDLQLGEQAYLTKIEFKDTAIVFYVETCGPCDPSAPEPNPYRAGVTFPFSKGYIASGDPDNIQGTIEKVFGLSPSFTQTTRNTAPEPVPPLQPAQPARPPRESPRPAPARIELGQSIEQVVSALGQPGKMVDLGAKRIFVYQDLKITFIDGKVADVQ